MKSVDKLLKSWSEVNTKTRNITLLPCSSGKGFGLFATDSNWRLQVPFDYVFSEENASCFLTRLPDSLCVEGLKRKKVVALIAHMLDNRGGPYLEEYRNLLPTELDLPSLWNKNELLLLRGTSLWQPVQAKLEALSRECRVTALGTDLQTLTLADALVRSRSIGIDGREYIVPLLDMANHSSSPTARWSVDGDAITLLPTEQCTAQWKDGSPFELEIDYGSRGAGEWLYSYGFIPKDHSNEMMIQISANPADPLDGMKRECWGEPAFMTLRDDDCDAPFLWLSVLGEEDGIQCTSSGVTYGGRVVEHNLKEDLRKLIKYPLFHLRVVVQSRGIIENRLALMSEVAPCTDRDDVKRTRLYLARELFLIERTHMEKVHSGLSRTIEALCKEPVVVEYLSDIRDESTRIRESPIL